jgi:hypothetical protein
VNKKEGEMKSKLIATLFGLCLGTGLTGGGSLSRGQPPLNTQSFAVSKYGTLLKLFDANGKSRCRNLRNILCDFAKAWRSLREKPIFHAKPAKMSKVAEIILKQISLFAAKPYGTDSDLLLR